MQKITLDSLKPGMRLQKNLFSCYGVRLLSRGTRLSGEVIAQLARVATEFVLADDLQPLAAASILKRVDPKTLSVGDSIPDRLVSAGGRLLSDSSTTIEPQHREALEFGAYLQKRAEPERLAAQRRKLAQEVIERQVEEWESGALELSANPETDTPFLKATPDCCCWMTDEQLLEWRSVRAENIRDQFARLLAGVTVDKCVFDQIVDELLGRLQQDASHVAQLALLTPPSADYLPDHSLSTAIIAMVIAAHSGWSMEQTRNAGLSGLLHDIGMLLLPERIRTEGSELDEVDQNKLYAHPGYSVVLLQEIPDIPKCVGWAAFRHHERANGTGYPHGLRGQQIGELPQLIAIADIASAMTGVRVGREQGLPHHALEELVDEAREGRLHRPLVRSLVEAIGLYPIGSYVRLSTEETAIVMAIHPNHFDRPIVAICDADGKPDKSRIVDLTEYKPWEMFILDGTTPLGIMQPAA